MDVRAATVAERPAAAGRIFGVGDQAARFLELVSSGNFDPRDLLVAIEADELRGAMIAQTLPGHLAVVVPPGADDFATADSLVLAALDHLKSSGVRLAQAYLDPGADTAALEGHGFRGLTQIEHRLRRRLPESGGTASPCEQEQGDAVPPLSNAIQFTQFFDESLFGLTLLATYEGSLDAPEANIGASIEDILAGYRHGNAQPNWWLVSQGGENVGVLLLGETASPTVGEIEYFGVVPSYRGRGIGAAIMNHSIATFQRTGVNDISVAVDVRNLPARKLYDHLGFQPFRVQNLWLRNIS
jgi:ribosomal protein S18 acetylase RimI-like enzyme